MSSLMQPVKGTSVAAARSVTRNRLARSCRMGGHGSRRGCGRLWSMQPITLTEEQHEFRRVLRQFCDDKIAPLAASNDERAESSWETFHALQAMELTALQLPAEYGGAGADLVTQAIAVEELARADASASLMSLIS